MTKRTMSPLLLLALGACVAQPADTSRPGGDTRIQRALAGAEAQPPRSCIGLGQLGTTGVDPQSRSILFDGRDGRLYLNRVASDCSLHRYLTVVTSTTGGQLCEGDRIQLLDVDGSSRISCTLGPFTPYRRARGGSPTGR